MSGLSSAALWAQEQPVALKRTAAPLDNAPQPIEELLKSRITLEYPETPLKDVVEDLKKKLKINIVLAVKKLEEATINLDAPVTCNLKNVRLETGLDLMLGDLGLTHVAHDDLLLITTPEDASSRLDTRVYDCRELLKLASPIRKGTGRKVAAANPVAPTQVKTDDQGRVQVAGNAAAPASPAGKEEMPADGGYTIDDLIDTLVFTVDPDSWDDVGGPGSIADFKGLVTISQTQAVHAKVERLLNLLHQAAGIEERVKVMR